MIKTGSIKPSPIAARSTTVATISKTVALKSIKSRPTTPSIKSRSIKPSPIAARPTTAATTVKLVH